MREYDPTALDEIVRAFFRFSESDDPVQCPECGEDVHVEFRYAGDDAPGLDLRCRDCGRVGSWRRPSRRESYKRLHLAYFRECRLKDRPPRCPIDDSRVLSVDFGDGRVEFRCPYCNRVGRIEAEIGNSRPGTT